MFSEIIFIKFARDGCRFLGVGEALQFGMIFATVGL